MDSPRFVEKSDTEAEPGFSPGIPAYPRTPYPRAATLFLAGESRVPGSPHHGSPVWIKSLKESIMLCMRTTLTATILAALSVMTAAGQAAKPAAATEPNLLLITIDTLRPDRLSCYGAKALKTPAIDALAARGALFEKAYAHDPVTLASHANILLGVTPLYHGVSENAHSKVSPAFLTLAEHLKAQGFSTGAFIGAFPLDSRFGLDQGFDVYDDLDLVASGIPGVYAERPADKVLAPATAWILSRTGRWFCWIHLWDPHAPYAPPEPYASRFAKDPYSGEAAFVDAQLGRLFAALRGKGWESRTVVAVTADHGESMGEHGELTHSYFAYDSTLHVPLILAGPGVKPGRIRDAVSHIDIFPTLCDLLAVKPPGRLQGRTLAPRISGAAPLEPRPIYIESLEPYFNKGCAPVRGFISGNTKFLETPVPEVYDLAKDPAEKTNLAPATDLNPLRKTLAGLQAALSSPMRDEAARASDPQTLARLRSLGYIAAAVAQPKAKYGPEDDVKRVLPIQQKLERAILLSDEGKTKESIQETNSLIAMRKDFAPAYLFLSQLLMSQDKTREAIWVLDESIKNVPGNFSLYEAYSTILIRAAQWDKAQEILERALGIVDYDPNAWDNLAIVHIRKGEPEKAREYLEKALALDPELAMAWVNLGAVAMAAYDKDGRKEHLAEAIGHLEKASELEPRMSLALRGLGTACLEAGRLDEAVAAWEKAVIADPADDYSTFSLGKAYLDKGDKFRAGNCFRRYIQIKGDKITRAELDEVNALLEKCR
jgi:arylsulfatase A-like enzyme/Flp pilus assembly protein TadD